MIENIVELLKKKEEVSDFIINEIDKESKEIFLIKDKLDMNRATSVTEYSIKVFKDFIEDGVKYKGDASLNVGEADSLEEIDKKIDDALFSASFVKNKWYDLPKNEDNDFEKIEKIEVMNKLLNEYDKIHEIIYKDYPYSSKVNSCEIFAVEGHKRVVTSKGTDVTYPISQFSFELVTDCSTGKEPVEIFTVNYLTSMDLKKVEEIVDRQLMETEGRAVAEKAPKLESMRVILSGAAVEDFFNFYISQASTSMIYQKMSKVEIGKSFQGDDAKEKITITMNPFLENSIDRKPVDAEGLKLEKFLLFENGIAKNLISGARYAHYLGVLNKGNITSFEVSEGKVSLEEFKKEDYLEIIAFSSFLMDDTTGDFGGEFRLAKLHRNGKTSYVTGGAISENIFEIQNHMRFSKEMAKQSRSITPKAVIIDKVKVTRIQEE